MKAGGTLAVRVLWAVGSSDSRPGIREGPMEGNTGWTLRLDHLYTLVGVRVRRGSLHASRLLPHLLGLLI